jgi:predicted nuclease of predicted toxin-antitoxin system
MPFRFKLDENLPRDAEGLLRQGGHDVHSALDEQLGGSPDPDILDVCVREFRILNTLDLDFADIRLYPPASHAGMWVLRPTMQSINHTLDLLRRALSLQATEPAQGRLWIVEPNRVRIRE